jgi:tripartite-type tricarboxylate transporter receptor subunit TctC
MKCLRRTFRHLVGHLAAGAAVLGILSVTSALHEAQAQSGRTVRAIVPTPPAGVNDLLARLMSDYLGKTNGLSIVVENRAGAAEVIGTDAVARAAPDGNTLLFGSAQVVINPQLRKVNYHPLESFEPICLLVVAPTVYSVNSASSYRTLNDLLDAARAKPGSVTMGSLGPGTPFDIGLAALKQAAKVDITFVPFNGNGPSINALLGGHVESTFNSYSSVSGQLKAGTLRPLAVASKTRIPPLPDVPTVAELGFKDYEVTPWFGVYAPAKTPKDSVTQFADWFSAALKAPEVKEKLAVQELYPMGLCGADFAAFLRKQQEDYGRAIRDTNFKVE